MPVNVTSIIKFTPKTAGSVELRMVKARVPKVSPFRLEAIKIVVVPKGSAAPGSTIQPFVESDLTTINIPKGLVNFGSGVLWDCNKLTNVSIEDGCASIPINTFDSCTKLTNINFPESIRTIGKVLFNGPV